MKDIKMFEDLKGETLASVVVNADKDQIRFTLADGRAFLLHHVQDCCESVWVEDINGNLDDLVGEVVVAEESTQDLTAEENTHGESAMWTFYRIATSKGFVVIRWCGASDYYSVSVDFAAV